MLDVRALARWPRKRWELGPGSLPPRGGSDPGRCRPRRQPIAGDRSDPEIRRLAALGDTPKKVREEKHHIKTARGFVLLYPYENTTDGGYGIYWEAAIAGLIRGRA